MGRPVRYGGEFGGVNEAPPICPDHRRRGAGPMVVEDSDRFRREIRREPVGVVFVIAPWNYPFLTAVNTIVPRPDRRQCGDPETRQPDPSGRRAAGLACIRAACRRMCSRMSFLTTRRPRI